MRKLILGGSFNPIHHGHLLCSRSAAEVLGFDAITLMPTAQPPHKTASATLASSADRLRMVHLAVENDPFFAVDELELHRNGPIYTVDTVRQLVAQGDKDLHWLIGADMLMYLPKWHQPLELMGMVQFVIVARPGWTMDWSALPTEFRHLQKNVVQAPLIDLSASDIRARVAAGKSIRYMTPDSVCDYIASQGLYRR